MNSCGRIFRISIFGESHGQLIGIIIDGCPPGISLDSEDFVYDLARRKPSAKAASARKEPDIPALASGVFRGITDGSPITIIFENTNKRSRDYDEFLDMPRPGHADFTAKVKYQGFNDHRGGGMFSGRMTLPLTAAGVVAKKIISPALAEARLAEAGGSGNIDFAIEQAMILKDSVGGIVECSIKGIPAGLGEPFFDSVESALSHLLFAIPGIKGVEFGAGFRCAEMKGSEFNDRFVDADGKTHTNHSGGINGGITNGNDIFFRVAARPPASIPLVQETFNFKTGEIGQLKIKGRHDLCFADRLPVIVESAAAIVLADFMLIRKSFRA